MELTDHIERVFREESGRIIASLIRFSGSFDLAEEALQDAIARALAAWPGSGIPDNPAAWLTAAARRGLIDQLRREKVRREKAPDIAYLAEVFRQEEQMPDDRLSLIFTCCHPAQSGSSDRAYAAHFGRTHDRRNCPVVPHA